VTLRFAPSTIESTIEEEARVGSDTLEQGRSTREAIRRAKSGARLPVDITNKAIPNVDGTLNGLISTE
jgi:hypothetical protein